MDERAYGTPALGVGAVLRGAFREGSEARVRAGLRYVQKGFLAGHTGGCPMARGRVCGILRSVLRPIFQTVLQGI